MKPDEAKALAEILCGAFGQTTQVSAYGWAVADFDYAPMQRAVKKCITQRERLPSIKALAGSYYAEKREERSAATQTGAIPCELCREEAGWRLRPGGDLYPPRNACVPFLNGYRAFDEDGKPGPVVWTGPNCCPSHAREVVTTERARQTEQRDAASASVATA